MLLTKSQILKGSSLKRELVSVPEWHEGGEVYVRTMTGQERDIFDQKMKDNSEDESMLEFRAFAVMMMHSFSQKRILKNSIRNHRFH